MTHARNTPASAAQDNAQMVTLNAASVFGWLLNSPERGEKVLHASPKAECAPGGIETRAQRLGRRVARRCSVNAFLRVKNSHHRSGS